MNLRVVSLPGKGGPNPYVDLFYDALLPHGIELAGELTFEFSWLKNNLNNFDAIHLHWPELLWRNYRPALLKRLRTADFPGSWRTSNCLERVFSQYFNKKKIDWFAENILYLREHGKKILYTWHNIEPHERGSNVDWTGNQVLGEHSDLIIFHNSWAEKECRKSYNINAQTVIMPHGNYDGVYPPPSDRSVVARDIGLDPSRPIVGCLGAIRDYKGVDIACEAIKRLGGAVQFLIAGKPHTSFDLEKLKKIMDETKGAVLIPRIVTDQEFSNFANLCDFILLPYRAITGSGALLATLTLGKGVVVSDLPYFRELLERTSDAGVLVEPNNAQELAIGIVDYLKVPAEIRNEAARKVANKYSWEKVILPVSKILKEDLFKSVDKV